jgi:hypothetical protein
LVFASLQTAHADPTGSAFKSDDYMGATHDRPQWSVGVYQGVQKRDLSSGFGSGIFEMRRMQVRAGYNVMPWLTLFAGVGQAEMLPSGAPSHLDSDSEYHYGFHVRLIEHEFEDVKMRENYLRIDLSYTVRESDGDDFSWEEDIAAATFSFINEIERDQIYVPHSIGLYVGPLWSTVDATVGSRLAFSEVDDLGLVGGLDIYFNPHFSFQWELQMFEENSTQIGLRFRF